MAYYGESIDLVMMVALDDCDKLICLGTKSWLHKDMNFVSCFVSGILRCSMRLFICRTSGTESVVLHSTKISLSLCIPPSNRQRLTVQTLINLAFGTS